MQISKTIIINAMNSREGMLVAMGACALFGILLLLNAVQFVSMFRMEHAQQAEREKNKVVIQKQKAADISAWHLFGEAPLNLKDASVIPKSQLNLELRGVYTAKPSTASQAIIAVKDGEEMVYKIGDEVPGGATIFKILPYAVIIKRNERYERLLLPRDDVQYDTPIKPVKMNKKAKRHKPTQLFRENAHEMQ